MKISKLAVKLIERITTCSCFLLALGVILFAGVIWGTAHLQWSRWKDSTSPVPAEIILDLCQKFVEPESEPLCSSSSEPYAYEFYPFILDRFEIGETDYSDVKEVLEPYRWKSRTGGPLADGRYYFIVRYDLRGDRKSALLLFFYQDNEKLFDFAEFYEGVD